MYPENDHEYYEETLLDYSINKDSITLKTDLGMLCIPKVENIPLFKGVPVRFYGKGFGCSVRGVFLAGEEVYYRSQEEEAEKNRKEREAWEEEARLRKLLPKNPDPQIAGFEWDDSMHEISGFGGGYEKICRTMVSQGCAWWSEHPECNPSVKSFQNITGVATAENIDAKNLEIAMMAGIDDCTGAMHQYCLQHIFYWKKLGSWGAYRKEMNNMLDKN